MLVMRRPQWKAELKDVGHAKSDRGEPIKRSHDALWERPGLETQARLCTSTAANWD